MNKFETAQIMAALRVEFPNGAAVTKERVNLWAMQLQSYDFDVAWQCTMELISEWTNFTMPPIAALIQKITLKDSERFADIMHEADQLIRKGSILTLEEFEKASPEIKEHFGSLAALRRLASMTIEQADRELKRFQKELPNISRRLHSVNNAAALNGVAQIGSPKK